MVKLLIFGDGDRVRERLENYLLSSDFAALSNLSERLTSSLSKLAQSASEALGAEKLMLGGDEILLRVIETAYSRQALEVLAREFHNTTSCTISIGVGPDIETAFLNLRRAKASGGGIIVDSLERPS